MTQPTDDLAAQMVREILNVYDLQHLNVTPASGAIARRYMEKVRESKSSPEIDAAIERESFGKWWRHWNPTVPLPSASSYTFDAWMAAIRAERAGKEPPHDR